MTDGPKCASCGQTLVAGNPVIRFYRDADAQAEWAHAACRRRITMAYQPIRIEAGRLAVTVTYKLDSEA